MKKLRTPDEIREGDGRPYYGVIGINGTEYGALYDIEDVENMILNAQREAIKFVAENAKMKVHDGHLKTDSLSTHVQIGANNVQVDKQSILDLRP